MHWLERNWYGITPLHLILLPASFIFRLLSKLRRACYRNGILGVEKLPVPVVVVGNITVGGSGKTPLTLWLAEQFIEAGLHPGIISRGYGGTSEAPREVRPEDDAIVAGDEPRLMAERGLCPVWTGRDRAAAARGLLDAHPQCDVLIADDGLQHYRLGRDFEIAVVDGVRRFGNGHLLPAGPLRESPERLKEVDAVVINGAAGNGQEFRMQLEGMVFRNLLNPAAIARPADFNGINVHALAGIGYPERFFSHLEQIGIALEERHPFPDHHRYSPADLSGINADAILMTEKDAVKCAAFATEKCWVLRVEAQVDPALARKILERIIPHGRQAA